MNSLQLVTMEFPDWDSLIRERFWRQIKFLKDLKKLEIKNKQLECLLLKNYKEEWRKLKSKNAALLEGEQMCQDSSSANLEVFQDSVICDTVPEADWSKGWLLW